MIGVRIPKLGMSTVEVGVLAVLVAVGDRVEPSTPVIEVESEKATVHIEAGVSGVVQRVLVSEGDEAKVGDVVVHIAPA